MLGLAIAIGQHLPFSFAIVRLSRNWRGIR
jgi:hypothetical protein